MNKILNLTTKGGDMANINLDDCVLVLNEFQNQWTLKGLYYQLIKGQLKKRNVLDNTRKALKCWRDKKLPVIHAPIIMDKNNKKGTMANLTNASFFTKGTWKADFTPGMYEAGDKVVTGRYTFNVFHDSNFEELLASMNKKTFIICGFTTTLCINITVQVAMQKGYQFIILNDCSATFTGFLQTMFDKKYKNQIVESPALIAALKKV